MVLIDTSVLIALYRRRSATLGQRLAQLANRNEAAVCGPVWVEFVGGFRSGERRRRIGHLLAAYPWLETSRRAFEQAAEWCATVRGIGPGDAVIAATAREHGATLLTLDRGFLALVGGGLKVEIASP